MVGLLAAAPVADRLQRLGRPADAGASLPRSYAAETALDLPATGTPAASPGPTSRPGAPRSQDLPLGAAKPQPSEPAPSKPAEEPADPPGEDYGSPTWLTIPKIDLDAPISPVGIKNGYYETARFRVGHHQDSVHPGMIGNSIYNGHLTSLTDGRVFARLDELREDDAIAIYTETHRTDWVVVGAGWVTADTTWYIAPTEDIRATLYTCGGIFDFRKRDYSHRYVVVAGLVRATPLSESGAGPKTTGEEPERTD